MYAIFDIDNCIADDGHRLHLIDVNEPDLGLRYKAYHDAMDDDEPRNQHIVQRHIDDGNEIAFVTSRPVEYFSMTYAWLCRFFEIPSHCPIIMRPTGDHRPSHILKPELLKGIFLVEKIEIAYDDKRSVLDGYVGIGVKCVKQLAIRTDPASGVAGNLKRMAKTYAERNELYGDSYKIFGKVMTNLFPNSLTLSTIEDWNRLGVLSMIVSKLTRYTANLERGGHQDSAHDMAVYAAMLEELTDEVPF